jgi:hypothetical protein
MVSVLRVSLSEEFVLRCDAAVGCCDGRVNALLALAMAAACPSRSGEPLGRDLARSPCDIRPSASPTVPPPPSSWEPRALTACASRAISDEAMGGDAGRAPGAIAGPHALPAAGGRLAADR